MFPETTSPKPLIYVLIGAALLRWAVVLSAAASHGDLGAFREPDTGTYLAAAENLAHSGRFANAAGEPDILRTPGYPLVLVPGIWADAPEAWTTGLQILLSAFTVLLVYRIAALLLPKPDGTSPGSSALRHAPMMAAVLYALEPLSIA